MFPKFAALFFGLLVMLSSAWADAGTLHVRDGANLLAPSDVATLETEVRRYPFDVLILTSSDFATKDDLERRVSGDVRANAVVVGIDPTHRHTSVHFGKSVGISPNQFTGIEKSGSPYFKNAEWREGIHTILSRASQEQQAPAGATGSTANGSTAAATPGRSLFFGGLLFIVVIAVCVVLIGFALRRLFTRMSGGSAQAGPPAGYGTGPFGSGYQDPGPYGPGYGPGYPPRGGGVGSGLIGAGLGGLAGYELGKMMGEREERDRLHDNVRERTDEASTFGPSRDGNPDAGGASSDWDADTGGDNGGGSDWGDAGGGGGSDWGDSGGGDSGGGDSGGGGGDW